MTAARAGLRDFWRAAVSSAIFPLHERLKGHRSVAWRRDLERSQWWSPEALGAHRARRLREFLVRVQRTVPYYRALFEEIGFQAKDLCDVGDLRHVPLLDKPTIRANLEALKAEGSKRLTVFNTGGSSGEPLTFYLSRERVSHDVAAKWRATRWWGVDIGDPEVVLWGSPIELGAQDRLKAIRDRLLRSKLLPAFAMSESNMSRFLHDIRRIRPRMLFGYPSALALLATGAERLDMGMDDLGIRVAFVTGERLYPEQKKRIASVFGCRVANGYGGRDAGFIAHECPQGGMHLSAEDVVVETVDARGAPVPTGRPGEIVVTHMATGEFPFIRYRTGDVGILGVADCPCGRGLPVLREIHGRTTDFVVAADGTIMHGLALIYTVRALPGVHMFKIVQESRDLVRVLVVPTGDLTQDIAETIRSGCRARLGSQVDVRVERVDAIPPERSGKYRYVVSRIATSVAG
ncbi:MAG: phenylacetate--CoA ligase family protein [Nitrococcus mobilis]|nr:phenylacetate--CoA ligase family protein [Nitrococcus mobilis]